MNHIDLHMNVGLTKATLLTVQAPMPNRATRFAQDGVQVAFASAKMPIRVSYETTSFKTQKLGTSA
jgi:hypothetical protein